MPRLGLEPTIRMFEQAKTVHALDRAATVIGLLYIYLHDNGFSTINHESIRSRGSALLRNSYIRHLQYRILLFYIILNRFNAVSTLTNHFRKN
jgi:hypothetical protein